jgi:branched-chain amino acid transport system permease protein
VSTLAFFLTQLVNALSQSALLFFLGVGLTLIFGLMRIVNFAHGALYMLGAFIGYSLSRWSGNFWLALAVAPVVVGLFGAAFEFTILRRLYRRDAHAFLMVTFGLALVVGEAVRLIWGSDALQVPPPASLGGVVFLLDEPFPLYRLFLVAIGVIVAVAIWQFLERSRLGLLIRATSQNADMASDLALAFMYLVMLAVLVLRPGGLLGKEA